jgi:hypothetical protein
MSDRAVMFSCLPPLSFAVSILPRITMSLEKYKAAMANTQKYWEKVD